MAETGGSNKGWFTGLPGWAQGVIAVAGVVVGGFGLYKLYQYTQHMHETQGEKSEIKESGKDLSQLSDTGIKPTYPDSEYKIIADALFTAVNGCGTYSVAIGNQFAKVKNNADMLKISTAYGRRNKSCWLTGGGMEGTLQQHLTDELSDTEMSILNSNLKKKGITYTF